MIVKDEEKYLKECLESVKNVVDEIVIVDTGSTDNTVKIAEEYGADIYQFKWINDFSSARNFALSKSSDNWILYLDADERLSKKSVSELRKLTERDLLAGYKCIVRSLDDNNGKPHYMKYVRLFRNIKGIEFTGAVHEQIESSLLENGYKIFNAGIEIIHLGYNASKEDIEKKARRNLSLLIKEYESEKSAYNAFQLGNTYSVLKDFKSARKYYLEATDKKNLKNEYNAYAYLNLSNYELKNHNLENALKFVNAGLQEDPSGVLLNMLASDIYFRLNKKDEAIQFCRKALNVNHEITEGSFRSELAVGLNSEVIISKGVYYSLISGNKKYLDSFMQEMRRENKQFFEILLRLIENKTLAGIKNEDIYILISEDNIDIFLAAITDYYDKKTALEILKLLKIRFNGNSKFHKTLGLLFSENDFFNEAAAEFRESFKSEEKDPSALFYLISILVGKNQFDEIPELLLFAEKEFGGIPEFDEKFEILKEKIGLLING